MGWVARSAPGGGDGVQAAPHANEATGSHVVGEDGFLGPWSDPAGGCQVRSELLAGEHWMVAKERIVFERRHRRYSVGSPKAITWLMRRFGALAWKNQADNPARNPYLNYGYLGML